MRNNWTVYDSVAEWCAKRGIAGNVGDPLPNLLSVAVCQLIDDDPEAFQKRVKECGYALAMNRLNLPDD